jgi:hypothetical protein
MNGRVRVGAVVWLVVLPCLLAGAATPIAQSPGSIQIVSSAGKCLEVDSKAQYRNGAAPVRVWECNGQRQQWWRLVGNEIRSDGNQCLDIDADAQYRNGGRVHAWDCNKSMQQLWKVFKSEIRSSAGKCLEVDPGAQSKDGAVVQIWDCTGEPQQRWNLR